MFLCRLGLIFFLFFSFSSGFASTCSEVLNTKPLFSLTLLESLKTLNINHLITKVVLNSFENIRELSPNATLKAYTILDREYLLSKGFVIEEFNENQIVVETDFGFSVLNEEEFKAWVELEEIIDDDSKAQFFVEEAAFTEMVYPGITNQASDWLKFSAYTHFHAQELAENFFKKRRVSQDVILARRKKEYSKLSNKTDQYMFPFDYGLDIGEVSISKVNAQIVLKTLSRHFMLYNLYVKKTNEEGEFYYQKLREVVDQDSLILFSRFPELLRIFPLFEGGHFSINRRTEYIGSEDQYILSDVKLRAIQIKQFKMLKNFVIYAFDDEDQEGSGVELKAVLNMTFENPTEALDRLGAASVESSFLNEMLSYDHVLKRYIKEFNEITGYNLQIGVFVLGDQVDFMTREYKFKFVGVEIEPYVQAAFYLFIAFKI